MYINYILNINKFQKKKVKYFFKLFKIEKSRNHLIN
jgi:hypothetical protein